MITVYIHPPKDVAKMLWVHLVGISIGKGTCTHLLAHISFPTHPIECCITGPAFAGWNITRESGVSAIHCQENGDQNIMQTDQNPYIDFYVGS